MILLKAEAFDSGEDVGQHRFTELVMTRRSRLIAQIVIVALALAQPIDILITNVTLAAVPSAFEINPVQAFLMATLGELWWVPKAALAVFLVYQALTLSRMNRWTWALLATGAKVYVFVLVSNFWGLM